MYTIYYTLLVLSPDGVVSSKDERVATYTSLQDGVGDICRLNRIAPKELAYVITDYQPM